MFTGKKVSQFIQLLESGATFDAAMAGSEVSKATARVQYSKWKKSKGIVREKKVKAPKKEKVEDRPAFPKDKDK